MKKLVTSIAFLTLVGCASTNYSDFEMGEAFISNLEVNEIHNLKKGQHKLKLSFNYQISKYANGNDLYSCSVQFLALDGTTTSIQKGKRSPCMLNKAKGEISITWPTVLDKTFSPSKEQLSNIKYPMEYFIAIHQQTGKNINQIIGKTPIQISEVKI
ncbi:hypothetical protein [Colwellia sp. MB3u-55]|uniref:hypothetical protein n=1 Tax=Colwellia sp. MB3u-55 TaxID=2759810 RepID=UPI0015F5F4C6|nr:hypothetical protein [Colwellia sp. MB3u-55]MBA6251694.1 hypothetical protein [Colwellia sp. MB3u-55]